jgi:hypothetical protein
MNKKKRNIGLVNLGHVVKKKNAPLHSYPLSMQRGEAHGMEPMTKSKMQYRFS